MNYSYRTLLTAVALALFSTGFSRAEDAPAKPWKNSTEASLVTTNGNSKGTTSSAKNKFTYDWARTGLEIVGGALGSKTRDGVTAEQYNASAKLTEKLVGKTYLYQRYAWDANRFAGYRHRHDLSAGVGYYLLDLPRHQWNTELGAGYINEQRILPPRVDFASGRAYTKYVFKFSDTSSFSQDVEYIHNFDDSDGYRLNTETALTASLTSHLALKTSFIWNRVGLPAAGALRDDTKTLVALVVNY